MHAVRDETHRPWPTEDGPWQVQLHYAMRLDRTECVGISIKPMVDDCPALDSGVLRKLRLAELIAQDGAWRQQKAQARLRAAERDPNFDPRGLANLRREADRAAQPVQGARPGRKPMYGDDHYAKVAAEYLTRADQRNPTQQIAALFHVERTTAATWIREARRRGLLPPTTQGRTMKMRGDR